MSRLRVVHQGCITATDGIITYAGGMQGAPLPRPEAQVIDAGGNVVMPGFIDSHTHLIFGGFRPDEFRMRLEGKSYMEIMNAGGGIQSTVNHTRSASEQELLKRAKWFVERMSQMGVTTVEAKSGYGLDTATEEKMLRVIAALKEECKESINVAATFLGAHAVPREWKGDTAGYTTHIIEEMLPRFKELAEFCDVFCEKDVFELDDSRRLLSAAKAMGYKLKVHADEIVSLGGGELAAELGAVSADHLLHVSPRGIEAMARAGVVATLLPLTAFALKEPYAPARRFIDSGAAVALATDLNPGSCFSGSIPLTISLAAIYMQMTIEEIITALTLNAAAAISRADTLGSIESGKQADLVILNTDNYNILSYYIGMNCVKTTIHAGKVVCNNF
jgi:imidazolonepropionase